MRMRIRLPKPTLSFLEVDELTDLPQTAVTQDTPPAILAHERTVESTVAGRLAAGQRPLDIASEFEIAKATVTFHRSTQRAWAPMIRSGISADAP